MRDRSGLLRIASATRRKIIASAIARRRAASARRFRISTDEYALPARFGLIALPVRIFRGISSPGLSSDKVSDQREPRARKASLSAERLAGQALDMTAFKSSANHPACPDFRRARTEMAGVRTISGSGRHAGSGKPKSWHTQRSMRSVSRTDVATSRCRPV